MKLVPLEISVTSQIFLAVHFCTSTKIECNILHQTLHDTDHSLRSIQHNVMKL